MVMQNLLKKFVFLYSENLQLSKIKFYCFYPLQNAVSCERLSNVASKICLTKNKGLGLLKFPLKIKKFNDSKKFFLSAKNFQCVFARYKNFCCVFHTRVFDKCFDVNHNFNLFKNRVAPFIQVLFILKNFEMRFFLAVLVVLSNKSRESFD